MKQRIEIPLRAAIVLALVAAISIHPVGPVKAASNTPVYVLGVSNPTDPLIIDLQNLTSSVTILPSITGLTSVGGNSILFIDGSWLATASSLDPTLISTIVQKVLAGVPSVVVRGDPSILPNSISGLMKYQNPGLPLIAEGVQVTGTLSDGTRQGSLLNVISGFDYSVSAEFQWANQKLAQPTAPTVLAPLSLTEQSPQPAMITQDTTGPFWSFILQATTNTGDQFQPFGRVITTLTLFELQNSGSSSFKWFNIFSNQTIMPGIEVYGSNYRNYLETVFAQPNNQTTNVFVSNGPTSQLSSGPTTVTYSVGTQTGVSNATVTSTQTTSYFLKNTNVTNTSSAPNVSWTHTISGNTAVGKLTLQVIPGWTDKVAQTAPLTIQGNLSVTFATFDSSQVTSTASTGVSFAISGG